MLKSASHLKPLAVVMIFELNVNSTPVVRVAPMLESTELYPLDEGIFLLSKRSVVLVWYASTVPLKRPLNRPKSSPISRVADFSQPRLGLANSLRAKPAAFASSHE